MVQVILGLGSNTSYDGKAPAELLGCACAGLQKRMTSFRWSSVYRTKAMYVADQDDFYNMAVRGFVPEGTTPHAFLDSIHEIEAEFGRDRGKEIRFGPRPLDIDIELFGDAHIDDSTLQIPHPRMHERAFVLIPVLEILKDSADAVIRERYAAYVRQLPDQGVRLCIPASEFCIPREA